MLNKNAVRTLLKGDQSDVTQELLDILRRRQVPFFIRAIVIDVISDPLDILPEQLQLLKGFVKDGFLIDAIPRNSIIARRARSKGEVNYLPEIFFPFLSSHVSLPVKPGEHVWVMYENAEESEENGWWISRISERRDVEDLNYVHSDRRFLAPMGGIERLTGDGRLEDTVRLGFNNGLNDGSTASLEGGIDAYEEIQRTALAIPECVFEPVPRFTKRPGDLVIQGSNNTLVSLGTRRAGQAVGTDVDIENSSGTIDIVVGRGFSDITAPFSGTNARGLWETDKTVGAEPQTEGDPEFSSDSARVWLSMRARSDELFEINVPGVVSTQDDVSCAVIRADELRLDARKNIKITIGGGAGSSIVLTEEGDVIVTPGPTGVLKLGGADADKALVCTAVPAGAASGIVAGTPLISTMGGVLGSGGPQGMFATRVLVK